MKTILCYGDSNTFGHNPQNNNRLKRHERWPGILEKGLGPKYQVIEEGLNHRTTIRDDPTLEYVNGKVYLTPCLNSHKPVDLVILMLGSNDLKCRFNLSASDIADGIGVLAGIILKSGAGPKGRSPELLILAPPRFGRVTRYAEMFQGYEEKEKKLAPNYELVAKDYGCHYLDISNHIQCPDTDGLHMEKPEHEKQGNLLTPVVQNILNTKVPVIS